MDVEEFADKVASYEDFVEFLKLLSQDANLNREKWENWTVDFYLEAISACLEDHGPNNTLIAADKPLSWQLLSQIFLMGKYYE